MSQPIAAPKAAYAKTVEFVAIAMARMTPSNKRTTATPQESATSQPDAEQGKALATRWCSSCHVVQTNQPRATDQAPPFASIARKPDFDANKLAFLLLKPHPNMPTSSLSQAEIADIAGFIATLK